MLLLRKVHLKKTKKKKEKINNLLSPNDLFDYALVFFPK